MNHGRFEELYERYSDGVLAPDELAEFKSALRDPVFAQQLVELSGYETVVYDELNLSNAEDEGRAVAAQFASGVGSAVAAPSASGVGSTVEVQPLSGVRRSSRRIRPAAPSRHRIRLAVFRRSSYWGWSVAAMLILLALACFFKFAPTPRLGSAVGGIAVLTEAADTVLHRGGDRFTPGADAALYAGDVLVIGARGRAAFTYPDQTSIELGPETRLELQVFDEAKRLVLNSGALDANVAKQPKGNPLTIATSHTESTVLGTELSVQAFETTMRLAVRTGQVGVQKTDAGSPVVVSAGQYVVAAKGISFVARPLPEVHRLLEDFEGKDIQNWICFADNHKVSKASLKHVAGKFGKSSLEIDFDARPGDGAGACCVFTVSQDWSGYDGVKFWVRGQGSMGMLGIEVMDNAPVSNPIKDQCERFVYEFTDDADGWREMSVPFRMFKRRASYQPGGAPNDGFTLTEVHGMSFMGSYGGGVLAVDQVELVRK